MNYRWPLLPTIATLTAVVIMFALGVWQLQRAEEKEIRLAHFEKQSAKQRLTLQSVLGDNGDIRDLPLSIEGRFDAGEYFLLDNKIHQGKVGYEVIAPVNTLSGKLLVNMGWIPLGESRQKLPTINLPQGQLALDGMVAIPQLNPMVSETAKGVQSWPVVIQQVDIDTMNELTQQQYLPLLLLLDDSNEHGFVRKWQPVVMPPEKHLAYAVQWFGLAVACITIFFIALKRKGTNDTNN